MNVMRNSGSINVCKTNRNRPGAFTRIAKIITLLMVMLAATGCVSLDRALNPITNQTKHYTFNYQDVSSGGVLVAAVVDRYQEIDIVESIEISERVQRQFKSERKELDVSSARPFFSKFVTSEHSGTNEIVVKLGGERYSGNLPLTAEVGQNYYQEMMEMYQRERWISPELLEQVREAVPQRFLVMARIENTSQDRSSSCSVRSAYTEQKEREEKSGEEEDYDEIKYQITRAATRKFRLTCLISHKTSLYGVLPTTVAPRVQTAINLITTLTMVNRSTNFHILVTQAGTAPTTILFTLLLFTSRTKATNPNPFMENLQ